MQIRLTRKLADCIDGVDLSAHSVGDVFDLPVSEAQLLIAEEWAAPVKVQVRVGNFGRRKVEKVGGSTERAEAADEPSQTLQMLDRISQVRRRLEQRSLAQTARRRVEDGIREDLHDSRARTVEKTRD